MFEKISMPEFIVVLVIVLIIFGHDKLPEVGNTIGKAIRGFKKAMDAPDRTR
jgi:sec-independent protein translocase protein TatA